MIESVSQPLLPVERSFPSSRHVVAMCKAYSCLQYTVRYWADGRGDDLRYHQPDRPRPTAVFFETDLASPTTSAVVSELAETWNTDKCMVRVSASFAACGTAPHDAFSDSETRTDSEDVPRRLCGMRPFEARELDAATQASAARGVGRDARSLRSGYRNCLKRPTTRRCAPRNDQTFCGMLPQREQFSPCSHAWAVGIPPRAGRVIFSRPRWVTCSACGAVSVSDRTVDT